MAGVRPTAPQLAVQALVIGTIPLRAKVLARLHDLNVATAQSDNAYTAMLELCRRPSLYRAVVVSLGGLYREELQIIPAVKRAHRQIKVWVTDLEGRPAALAEAMRLGADGLLGEDGLHRLDGSADESFDVEPADPPPPEDVWDAEPADGGPAAARPALKAPHRVLPAAVRDEDENRLAPAAAGRPAAERVARVAAPKSDPVPVAVPPPTALPDPEHVRADAGRRNGADDPVLSPDELRALLHDPAGDPF